MNRGLLVNLNSEAELAGVLGHEIGHITARHPARRQARGVAASLGAMAAAILTGSNAIGQLANIGAQAWMMGYGRENEMEADRLGMKYMVKAGYNPESIGDVFTMFQAGEKFERQRAAEEGREPRLYHGVFSSHPSPDERAVQAAKGAANIKDAPPEGWLERHDEYLTVINGIAYGTSKAQGVVRDNRFYHADMGITVAFPRGWTIENQRDRLIAFTPKKDAIMQIMIDAKPDKQAPREFLLTKLKGQSTFKGEPFTTADGEGYMIVARTRIAHRQRHGPGALGSHLSRPERLHFRGRKPLGARRRARSRRPHQVDGADPARPEAIGISARRAISHQSGEGHRCDQAV